MSNSGPHNARAAQRRAEREIAPVQDKTQKTRGNKASPRFAPRISEEERLEKAELEAAQCRDRIAFASKWGKRPLSQHVVKQMSKPPVAEAGEGKEEGNFLTEDDPSLQTPDDKGRREPVNKAKDGNKKRDLLRAEELRQNSADAGARDAAREIEVQAREEVVDVPEVQEKPEDDAQEESKRLEDMERFCFRFQTGLPKLARIKLFLGWFFLCLATSVGAFGSFLSSKAWGVAIKLVLHFATYWFGVAPDDIVSDLMGQFFDAVDGYSVILPVLSNLYLLIVVSLLWVGSVALIARYRTGSWGLMRCYHEYKVLHIHGRDARDLRADSYSTRDLKHKDPFYADVRYIKADVGMFWLTVHSQVNMVSLELFTQLSVPNILVPNRDPKLVALALQQAAGRVDSINISRYNVFKQRMDGEYGEDTFGNTIRMTWAFYLYLSDRADAQPFRSSP